MIRRIRNMLWTATRALLLKIRGRVWHSDEFGMSYWLWANTRAMGTRAGQPRTDDTGVLLQLTRVYEAIGQGESVVSVDAGAYIGVISLAMFRFGPSDHVVHSFEADEINYSRLIENVSDVSNGSIVVHRRAVSDFVGEAEFVRNQDPGTNSLGEAESGVASTSVVSTVSVTTLDSFAREQKIDRIDVLKIDVEGADVEVLRGASGLLGEGQIRVVVVEIPLTAERRAEMNALLAGHGFALFYIVRNSDELIPASEADFVASTRAPLNMLALGSELAVRLGVG